MHDEDLLLAYALDATVAAGRGALPADSQRRAGLRASRAARVGAPLVDGVARRSARHVAAHRRGADRGGRADRAGARLRRGRRARSRRTSIPTRSPSRKARPGARSRPMRSSRWRSRISTAGTVARAARRRITIKSSCTRTRNPSRGGAGRADLPIDTVKRLLCDCSLVTVVEDANGNPLDVGRKQRTVSTPLQARALRARSRLHVPRLSSQAVSRRASPEALDQRRRDESRQPDAAVHVSPSSCCTKAASAS